MKKFTIFLVVLMICLGYVFAQLQKSDQKGQIAKINPKKGEEKYKMLSKKWEKFKKPSAEELKKKLNDIQFKVTQKDKTEKPFKNEYWDNKKEGIYVDIVSGEPLFSSTHKYKSGTGWPSFYKAINSEALVEKIDKSLFRTRIEIRSKYADSHLGHVFDDGPEPTGKRFCMNSAAMRFIAKADMAKEGYEDFLDLFK